MSPPYREKPVQFGPNQRLYGVLCAPSGPEPARGPVVVMPNSGLVHRVGVNRIHVLIARALAEQGTLSLRIDLSGIGESERRKGEMSLNETVHLDLQDAFDFLVAKQEAETFVVLGLCSGAYDSLQLATTDSRVVGTVAIDLFGSFRNPHHVFKHYTQRLGRAQSWRNALLRPGAAAAALMDRWRDGDEAPTTPMTPDVRPAISYRELDGMLHAMHERGVQSLFLFTNGLEENYNYEHQFRDCYPTHVSSGLVSYAFFPNSEHTFQRPRDREALVAKLSAWFAETPFERSGRAELHGRHST